MLLAFISSIVIHTNYISIINKIPIIVEGQDRSDIIDAAFYKGYLICQYSLRDITTEERLNSIYMRMIDENYAFFLNDDVYKYMLPIVSRYIESNCSDDYWNLEWMDK